MRVEEEVEEVGGGERRWTEVGCGGPAGQWPQRLAPLPHGEGLTTHLFSLPHSGPNSGGRSNYVRSDGRTLTDFIVVPTPMTVARILSSLRGTSVPCLCVAIVVPSATYPPWR